MNVVTRLLFDSVKRYFNVFLHVKRPNMENTVKRVPDRRCMLRVKLKSLAAESKMIRREELRHSGRLREELCLHRRGVVRAESRATHIAYQFIRGRTLEQIGEQADALESEALKAKVDTMVKKYGGKIA